MALTEIRKFAAKGGKSRAEKYGHHQLSEWAKLGGRPAILRIAILQVLKAKGLTTLTITKRVRRKMKLKVGAVPTALTRLRKKGYVVRIISDKGSEWHLTPEGKRYAATANTKNQAQDRQSAA